MALKQLLFVHNPYIPPPTSCFSRRKNASATTSSTSSSILQHPMLLSKNIEKYKPLDFPMSSTGKLNRSVTIIRPQLNFSSFLRKINGEPGLFSSLPAPLAFGNQLSNVLVLPNFPDIYRFLRFELGEL